MTTEQLEKPAPLPRKCPAIYVTEKGALHCGREQRKFTHDVHEWTRVMRGGGVMVVTWRTE